MKKIGFVVLASIIGLSPAYAQKTVVGSNACSQMSHTRQPFILVLKKGQDLVPSLIQCFKDAKLKAASFNAIGFLKNPELAYYDLATKKYYPKTFPGLYELVSLTGNLSVMNQDLVTHIHAALGTESYQMIAGHFNKAEVGATAEITIIPFTEKMVRQKDPETGANLLKI